MIKLDSRVLRQVQPEVSAGWEAGLQVAMAQRHGCTRLVHSRHWGPLRVQRPFYPGVNGECHLYLLHPPGGMVSGDRLAIDVAVGDGARGLVTTPSAGKIYRGNDSTASQRQTVDCQVSGDGCLEWLPQETIVFDGARGELVTRVALEPDARCALWDIICLGRPASGEKFASGFLRQSLEISRGGLPLYRERNLFVGGSPMLAAPWGLHGCPVAGSLLLTVTCARAELGALRDMLAAPMTGSRDHPHEFVAVSQLDGLLAVRYLGHCAARCRALFTLVWQRLRPALCGLPAVEPRIWRT